MKWRIARLILIGILFTYLGFHFGEIYGQDISEPQIITIVEEIEVPIFIDREIPVYRTVTIETEVIKEVIKYEGNKWAKEFESRGHFIEWYKAQHFTILLPSSDYLVDCDDYADWVQTEAIRQGYKISVVLTTNGFVGNTRVREDRRLHMGNLVMIGNDIYYVEPKIDEFKIIWISYRD